MSFSSNFEKKFGKYAIKNLSLILILCYACGYLFQWIYPDFLHYLYLNPYEIIFHGQIWRLVTWIVVPPSRFDFFTLLMLYFYYSIGTTLERTWGTYRYNVYLFSGALFTILGAFLLFGYTVIFQQDVIAYYGGDYFALVSSMFSTYYVNMSIFLAFASTFPNMQVLLFFLIPLKVKILGIIYGAILIYQFIVGYGSGNPLTVAIRFVIGASLMNFIVFFLTGRGKVHMTRAQATRSREFKRKTKQAAGQSSHHKCAICGRTDETNPELQFRYCSKCAGSFEYCEEHIFTHTHVRYYGDEGEK